MIPTDVDGGSVVVWIVRTHRLGTLLVLERIVTIADGVVSADGLEGVCPTNQQFPRADLRHDPYVILATLLQRQQTQSKKVI